MLLKKDLHPKNNDLIGKDKIRIKREHTGALLKNLLDQTPTLP